MTPALPTAAGVVLVTMPALLCLFTALRRRPLAEILPLLPLQAAATIYLSVSTAKQPLTMGTSDLKWALQALTGLLIIFLRIALVIYPGMGSQSTDLRNTSDDEENHWTCDTAGVVPAPALVARQKSWNRHDSVGHFTTAGRTAIYNHTSNVSSSSSGVASDPEPENGRQSALDASETVPQMSLAAWATSLFS